jgi:uncharacterized RDD family membrane protein YckC
MKTKIFSYFLFLLPFLFFGFNASATYEWDKSAEEVLEELENNNEQEAQSAYIKGSPMPTEGGFEEWKKWREAQGDDYEPADRFEVARINQENQSGCVLEDCLYRNEEYEFRIKFPVGWEIKDGDGEHIVKKAAKDGSTVFILVKNEDFLKSLVAEEDLNSLSDEDIRSLELNDFSDEDVEDLLDSITSEQLESFPGSSILEKGVRYIDNRKAAYLKMNQVYKVQDITIEGIYINYSTIHKGKLYQIGGFYPTIPINGADKESAIVASLATFVFEDWNDVTPTTSNYKADNTETQVQDGALDLLNWFAKSFITGLFLVFLAGAISLFLWLHSKITKKNIQVKKSESGLIIASKTKRLANFAIDFCILITGVFALISYLAIENAWMWFFEDLYLFQVIGIISYYFLFEWIFGRTPGKFITRTKVVAVSGNKPNFGQILGRTLARIVPFEVLSFLGKNSLWWHDRWSNTLVTQSNYQIPNGLGNFKYCKECGNKINTSTTICNKCQKEIIKNN